MAVNDGLAIDWGVQIGKGTHNARDDGREQSRVLAAARQRLVDDEGAVQVSLQLFKDDPQAENGGCVARDSTIRVCNVRVREPAHEFYLPVELRDQSGISARGL